LQLLVKKLRLPAFPFIFKLTTPVDRSFIQHEINKKASFCCSYYRESETDCSSVLPTRNSGSGIGRCAARHSDSDETITLILILALITQHKTIIVRQHKSVYQARTSDYKS